ncbi:hypothetical protein [uncultured Algibacter sp.]|uniref:hypothetical protein n=1 Tax=uncultured Algibacter sp. TaxID=298659 RepID=UPI00260A3281|nr:hypothetical protein [uncultured Algibacter sp.]
MSEKKHIDRIFQESFKDFEVSPSDTVWTKIEAELEAKKKKRRIIPIWWRYAGVAALLLLFLSIGGMYLNNPEEGSNNIIVDSNVETNTIPGNNSSSNHSSNKISESEVNDTAPHGSHFSEPKENLPIAQPKTSTIASSNSKVNTETLVSINNNKDKSELAKNHSSEEAMAPKKSLGKNRSGVIVNNNENNILNNNVSHDKSLQESMIPENSLNNIALAEDKDKIQENKIENNPESAVSALTIEEAMDKNKDLIQGDKPENRWSVAPNIAPVYFNTLNEGSSIDGQFNSNSKTGDVNMSYGISTSYALNKKLKVRSGINKVNLGYNTNDVITFRSTARSSSSLKNVDAANNGLAVASDQSQESNIAFSNNAAVGTNSTINQSFGYIEVPLEIQYTFVDKRLGVNVIGGFSSFFLDSNEIYSERENGARTFLGEANNINDVSYSANLGLGLNYKFSKKIDLNLEPTFKYQFNTFNNTSGNFTPFFIGVYTGFAIKF